MIEVLRRVFGVRLGLLILFAGAGWLFGEPEFATFFRLKGENGWVRVETIAEMNEGGVYLVPKDMAVPEELKEGVTVIRTPVERIVALSTTYLGAFTDLGRADRIVAVADTDRVTSPEIRERIETGATVGVGDGAAVDLEALVALRPDVVFMSVFAMESFGGRGQLERLGIPVVATAAYLEPHPLGRAEWIRFFAAFTGDDEAASRRFEEISDVYQKIRYKVRENSGTGGRPTVLTGAPWGGVWYCAGGGGYLARLIEDAGGSYVWEDRSTMSVPRDLETVLAGAAEVDYWINVGAFESREGLLGTDRRFRFFRSLREGRVYNSDLGLSLRGGVPFWERGAQRPDEVLADLGAIFHPELFPDHEMRYYRRLR